MKIALLYLAAVATAEFITALVKPLGGVWERFAKGVV